MTDSTRPDRRNIKYIVVVVLGSLLLGMGVNLLLVYTGAVTGDSFKTTATVVSCETSECNVTYDRAGRLVQATLQGTRGNYEPGAQPTVTVYESDENRAYPEKVVPLGFAITVAVVGLMVTTFGGVRLFRFWRDQARVQRTVLPKNPEPDIASDSIGDAKDDK